jgi:MoaA/NifB/PqqE/SkfB family radical SAM enzyme
MKFNPIFNKSLYRKIWKSIRQGGRTTKKIFSRKLYSYLLTVFRCERSIIPVPVSKLDLELTNFCNQKCQFCTTGIGTTGRPDGMMEFSLFKKIVDQVDSFTAIQFAGYGEPFLNLNLEKFLDYAGSIGVKNIDIFSNFGAIKEERIRGLLDHPFRKLVISLDGMSQESFTAYKGVDQFNTVWKNIEILADEAEKRKTVSQKLYVKIVVSQKNKHEIDIFKEKIKKLNLIPEIETLNTAMAFVDSDIIGEFEDKENSRYSPENGYSRLCRSVWNEMLVFWDGRVTVCCVDSTGSSEVGNVNDESLMDLFNKNVKRRQFRADYFDDPGQITICKNCHAA